MSDISNYLDIALNVVRSGTSEFNQKLLEYSKLEANHGKEVKLIADRELNSLIIKKLKKLSSFNILSEENNEKVLSQNGYNWILDPLDGSFNFLRGIPAYCISLALWEGNNPLLGVIYDLRQDDIYYGVIGQNAYKNKNKISVSRVRAASEAVLCTGFPVNYSYSKNNIIKFVDSVQHYKKIRLFGSAAISLSYLASGVVDAYIEENIMIWDVAAGIAIVKAAGGKVDFSPGKLDNSLVVKATNNFL